MTHFYQFSKFIYTCILLLPQYGEMFVLRQKTNKLDMLDIVKKTGNKHFIWIASLLKEMLSDSSLWNAPSFFLRLISTGNNSMIVLLGTHGKEHAETRTFM